MEVNTSELLTPLAQLLRLQMQGGAPNLIFVSPLIQLVRLVVTIDYRVESGAPNLRFVNPLDQLVRLQVGNEPPSLGFVNHSRSTC